MKLPPLSEHLLGNVFFDTCVYHQPGIELLTKVIPIDNILLASEMVGAVRGIAPETKHHFDDTRRYIDQIAALSAENRAKIFAGNARARSTVASTPILIAGAGSEGGPTPFSVPAVPLWPC
jgi:4-oxalmesaconate hydratase